MSRHADAAGQGLWIVAVLLAAIQAVVPQSAWSTWDAWAVWDFKTRALLEYGGRIGPWLRDPEYGFTHQEYPLLWPGLHALAAVVTGGFDTRIARLLSVPFAAVVPPLLAALLAELGIGRGRWLVAGGVAVLPAALAQSANGYVDWPLAAVESAGLLMLVRAVARPDGGLRRAAAAGLAAGIAANLKNEGLVFGLGIILALSLAVRRRGVRPASVAAAAGVFLVLAVPWRWYAHAHALRAIDFGLPAARAWAEFPTRFLAFLGAAGREAFGAGPGTAAGFTGWLNHQLASWAGAWFAAAWVLATGWRTLASPTVRAVALVLGCQVAGAAGAYAFTILDVHWLLAASLDRLMLQWVPAVACLAAVAAAGSKMKPRESR